MAQLPDGPEWVYEVKLDGYRALAINGNGEPSLYSRRRKSFNRQYLAVFDALCELPENTVVDGESSRWTMPADRTSIFFSIPRAKRNASATSFSI